MEKLSRLYILLFVLACGSCAPFLIKHKPLPPVPDPHAFLQAAIDKTLPERIMASAQMKTQSPQGNMTMRATIFAHAVSSLRIELYGFLNQLFMLFSTDGTNMAIYYPHTASFYSGAANDKNLSFVLGDEISPADAVNLLCGIPPIIPYDQIVLVNTPDSSLYQFELVSHDHWRQHVWIDPTHKNIVKYILYDESGKRIREFSFNEFSSIKNYIIPLNIALILSKSNTHIVIRYQHIEIPRNIENQLFAIMPPDGVKTYPLHELPQSSHPQHR